MNKTSGKNTRKCSACQQVGHRKDNTQCPMYVKVVKNNRKRTVNESEEYGVTAKTVRVDENVELRENESDWVDRKLLENRVKSEKNFGYHDFRTEYQEVLNFLEENRKKGIRKQFDNDIQNIMAKNREKMEKKK